jgi:hypothetical protein
MKVLELLDIPHEFNMAWKGGGAKPAS